MNVILKNTHGHIVYIPSFKSINFPLNLRYFSKNQSSINDSKIKFDFSKALVLNKITR